MKMTYPVWQLVHFPAVVTVGVFGQQVSEHGTFNSDVVKMIQAGAGPQVVGSNLPQIAKIGELRFMD